MTGYHHFTDLASAGLRKIRSAIRSTHDYDVEQARLRVVLCAVAFGYVTYLIRSEGSFTQGLTMGLIASAGDALVGASMLWWMRRSNLYRVPLRYLGIVSDNTALTIGMAGAGESGVAVFGIYLWVTIGNGFRFGARFLMASYWLTLVGFGLQLMFVPYWEQHNTVGIGLFIAAIFVPLYVLGLVVRLRGQKEEAEQLSNAKSRFVANVSHELRTPLTGVFAVYDLLRARKMTPDDRELVGMLGNAVKTLKSSVDAILQMSKLEAGAERAEDRTFNLWFFVQQIATLVRPQSTAKGLAWSLKVDPAVPATVVGDPVHLSHVLGNLLNNAFKFTASGGVSLRVGLVADDRNVRFEVIDTGIGIPLEHQEHLFERFVQVDNSATRRHGGTGLGTSIARDLTELMGGRIGVVSAPGQGSTFWIEIPLPRPEVDAAMPADWDRWKQVLIVGDPSKERDEVVRHLTSLDLHAVVTTGGHDPVPDSQRYLATVSVMSAGAAASYVESVERAHGEMTCPWIVVAPSYSATQRAALIAGGAAGLLSLGATANEFRAMLVGLLYRIDVSALVEEASLPDTGVVRSLNVLLADDNHSNQMLLSRILENAGHRIVTAERGDRAYDIMAAGGIDLALLDLNMPDMTGPDVVKLFRAGGVGGATKLPIIILSADATPAAKQESIDAGADEFLTKPVSAAVLLATIERVVAGSLARTTVRARPEHKEVSHPSGVTALVDTDRIQSLRRIARGDVKFLDTYIGAAFDELERAIVDLRKASNSSDVRGARDALHIIEGTGASIGAIALVANCKSMRNYLSIPDDPDRAGALAELSTTYMLTKSTVLASLHETRSKSTRSGAARD